MLGDRVSYAVQPEARGTADAVARAAELIDRDAPVVVLAGDVPLITPATLAGSSPRTTATGQRRRWPPL